jgi:hypothetical protein
MVLTLADARDLYLSSPTLANKLNTNAIEALCECDTYLFWNQFTGLLAHARACLDCYDFRTGKHDTDCPQPHTCGRVTAVACGHGRCDGQAKPYDSEGVCLDDLDKCCGCCQPPDYDHNDL